MYVFDTDVLSQLIKGRLPESAQRRIAGLPRERRFTTAITIGELFYGAIRSVAATRWLATIEDLLGDFSPLAFDAEAGRRYGEIRAFLERSGRRLDDPDLRIAATCIANDRILVSGNERHFARVPGLRFENWLRAQDQRA